MLLPPLRLHVGNLVAPETELLQQPNLGVEAAQGQVQGLAVLLLALFELQQTERDQVELRRV